MKEKYLGFDFRLSVQEELSALWTPERRELFLWRPEVSVPLSVDTFVWPSLLYDAGEAISPLIPQLAMPVPRAYCTWGRFQSGIWSRFHDLSDVLVENSQKFIDAGSIIAISLMESEHVPDQYCWMGAFPDVEIPSNIGRWKKLGIDVADTSLISLLSNLGLEAELRAGVRARWSALLNEHGLFTDSSSAAMYMDFIRPYSPESFGIFSLAIYQLDPWRPPEPRFPDLMQHEVL